MKQNKTILLIISAITITMLACNLPFIANTSAPPAPTQAPVIPPPVAITPPPVVSFPTPIPPTNTPAIVHLITPASSPSTGDIYYDVYSNDTAPEKRAPYGDSYEINRLERPFKQDMSYIPHMDIVTYNLSQDADWYYISIELIGGDPNHSIGINYGVEIDNDIDGFGDTIVWAEPPYTKEWGNTNVQVYHDNNHDTGGLSAGKSDAPIDTDGYETLVFDRGLGDDPDLAWVRVNAGLKATVQFAFKKSLTDGTFMLGVLSDAGLRDVGMLDYNDRFTSEVAGSPVRSNQYYPLGELYLVDNACRSAYGFAPTGYEPQICPTEAPPTREPGVTPPTPPTPQVPNLSDVNSKENFASVDSLVLLEKLATIEIQSWNYITQDDSIRHIGPMAQDFYATFNVGDDNTHISSIDPDGVALAAIQGLYEIAQDKDHQISEQQAKIDNLEARVSRLEASMANKSSSQSTLSQVWILLGFGVTVFYLREKGKRQ